MSRYVNEFLTTEITSASQFQLAVTSFDETSDTGNNLIKDELHQAVKVANNQRQLDEERVHQIKMQLL